jgi:hypothetical protein
MKAMAMIDFVAYFISAKAYCEFSVLFGFGTWRRLRRWLDMPLATGVGSLCRIQDQAFGTACVISTGASAANLRRRRESRRPVVLQARCLHKEIPDSSLGQVPPVTAFNPANAVQRSMASSRNMATVASICGVYPLNQADALSVVVPVLPCR